VVQLGHMYSCRRCSDSFSFSVTSTTFPRLLPAFRPLSRSFLIGIDPNVVLYTFAVSFPFLLRQASSPPMDPPQTLSSPVICIAGSVNWCLNLLSRALLFAFVSCPLVSSPPTPRFRWLPPTRESYGRSFGDVWSPAPWRCSHSLSHRSDISVFALLLSGSVS